MTQKDKELLLKDLCARLPYEVICQMEDKSIINDSPFYNYTLSERHIELFRRHKGFYIKPYLRPMHSMTEEEKDDLKKYTCPDGTGTFDEKYLICPISHYGEHISYDFMSDILSWLNAHHFDYRGLIEKGLAIAVIKENNPYKD